MRNILYITCMLVPGFFLACTGNKALAPESTASPDTDEIMTVVVEFLKGPNLYGDTIRLHNVILSPGFLKERPVIADSTAYYIFQFTDERENIYKEFLIEDPLRTRMEYVNDKGDLESKLVEKDRTAVPLRLNYEPGIKYLVVGANTYDGMATLQTFNLSDYD